MFVSSLLKQMRSNAAVPQMTRQILFDLKLSLCKNIQNNKAKLSIVKYSREAHAAGLDTYRPETEQF